MAELAERLVALGRANCRLRRQRSCGRRAHERDYLVDNPTRRCPGDRQGARASSATTAQSRSTRGSGARCSGTPTTGRRPTPDAGRDRRHRLRRARHAASAWPRRASRSSASTSTRGEGRAGPSGRSPIHEAGLEELLARNAGRAAARRRPTCAAAVRRRRSDVDRGRHARSTARGSTSPPSRPRPARSARRSRPSDGYPRRRRQEHGRPGHDATTSCVAAARGSVGGKRRAATSASA